MKYPMDVCIKKLQELETKYPEIIRAKEIAKQTSVITSLYAKDKEIEEAFEKLEALLKQKNDGN